MKQLVLGAYIFILINYILLTCIFLIKKSNSRPNILLGLFMLMHVLVFGFCLLLFLKQLPPSLFYVTVVPAGFVGPLALLYCQSLLAGNEREFSRIRFIHFLPPVLFFILLSVPGPVSGLFSPSTIDPDFLSGTGEYPLYIKVLVFIYVPAYYLYTLLWCIKSAPQQTTAKNVGKVKFARHFALTLNVFILLFYLYNFSLPLLDKPMNLGSSAAAPVILFLFFAFMLRKALKYNDLFNPAGPGSQDEINNAEQDDEEITPVSPEFSDEYLAVLEEKLHTAFSSEKAHLINDLSLKKLSGMIGMPSRHVSAYINLKHQKTFTDFINSLRIEEAKKMLLEPELDNLKLEAIGEKAGFNSRATFFTNFKKYTGHTPSTYKKNTISSPD